MLNGHDAANSTTPFFLVTAGSGSGAPLTSVSSGYAVAQHSGGAYYPPPGITAPAAVTRFVTVVPNSVVRARFSYPDGGPVKTVNWDI